MKTALRTVIALMIALTFLALNGPAGANTSEKSLYAKAEQAYQKFKKDQKAQKRRDRWLQVIRGYERVVAAYPKGRLAPDALANSADLYLALYRISRLAGDLDEARAGYRRVTRDYPKAAAAARSQFKLGEIQYHLLKNPDRAYVELLKVELNYPGQTREVEKARAIMAKIAGHTLPKEPVAAEPAAAKKAASKQAVVTALRYWHNQTYSRIAIDVDREVRFSDHLLRPNPDLKQPMRIYMDLENTRVGPKVTDRMKISDGLLSHARVAQYDQSTVRIVLDIHNIHNYRIFSLTDPYRIVVDVTGAQKPGTIAAAAKKTDEKPLTDLRDTALKRPRKPRGPAQVKPNQASLARQLGLGIRTVVIDPGHGGKDHGATGITGLREKDLTLKVSRMLAAKIKKRLGLKVYLTRRSDIYLTLEERTARANTRRADLFISIHGNAHKNPRVTGIETYILNVATDKEAMRVAALENAVTTRKMSDLQMILSDLMLNSKINESAGLGIKVHRHMVGQVKKRYRGVRDLGVKQAPFYVLIGANMPSILLELGFMTNKTEESRLRNTKYLERLTDGIVEGIKAYQDSIKKPG